MKKTIYLIVLYVLFFPLLAWAELLPMEEFSLPNGLRVIVISNHKAPIVKQMLWYKVGSIDEPVGKGGVAHLLEHLMFRGTKNIPDSGFNEIVARHGADSNAFTSTDFTAYHELSDISRLEVMMALEADRMVNLEFEPEAFKAERQIVFQERKQRIDNNPTAQFGELLNTMLWQKSPYARPVTGTEEEILNLTPADVRSFYQTYYSPANAVLVLSGDINLTEAQILVQKYFGSITKKTPKSDKDDADERERLSAGKYHTTVQMQMRHPEVRTPRVVRQYLVPSLKEDVRKAYALMVFAQYLGGGDSSFLNKELVLSGRVAAAAASYSLLSRGAGVFAVSAVPMRAQTALKTETLLSQAVQQAMNALDKESTEKEKQKILSGLVYIKDNPSDAAMLVGQMAALGFSLADINAYEDNIRQVTTEEIKTIVLDMIENAPSVTGFLLPAEYAATTTEND